MKKEFTFLEIDRIIEMAWEDRTTFDAIKLQFGKNSTVVAVLLASFTLIIALYGAASNAEFDFLNNYKIYPSECKNCNIRPEEGFQKYV